MGRLDKRLGCTKHVSWSPRANSRANRVERSPRTKFRKTKKLWCMRRLGKKQHCGDTTEERIRGVGGWETVLVLVMGDVLAL